MLFLFMSSNHPIGWNDQLPFSIIEITFNLCIQRHEIN